MTQLARAWRATHYSQESSLHQIAPYVGKMKPSMARRLVEIYSRPGKHVLDPFCGSGTIPLEAAVLGRRVTALDVSPYALLLTRAKLFPPESEAAALTRLSHALAAALPAAEHVDVQGVPSWVRTFFHERTLREIVSLSSVLRQGREHFLLACLAGILHHQRPGFLSFPASHSAPYLRTRLFPPTQFPEMYEYRDVSSRMIKKIRRVYRQAELPAMGRSVCEEKDAAAIELEANSIDAIITSPPYMDQLDYGRDNRLRLWLLGHGELQPLDHASRRLSQFLSLMQEFLERVAPCLKPGAPVVLVIGEAKRSTDPTNLAEMIVQIALQSGEYEYVDLVAERVPRIKRIRDADVQRRAEWTIILERSV